MNDIYETDASDETAVSITDVEPIIKDVNPNKRHMVRFHLDSQNAVCIALTDNELIRLDLAIRMRPGISWGE